MDNQSNALSDIYDYSTVTDFEKFVQSIEESLSTFKLNNGWGQATQIGNHRVLLHAPFGDVELFYVHRRHHDLSLCGFSHILTISFQICTIFFLF